ncbi:MAG: ZPR1 zinc finger domain-containing protein [Candidatus Woesearchaeota archaeon]|nr:ZPR1 zinc finger domain-containing protein [Candidatus Woesearchaeota archaeon]
MQNLDGQPCPMCLKKTLTLSEDALDVPPFGKFFVFGMHCKDPECTFQKSDVESEQPRDPCRITFTIEKDKDMTVRVIKSSAAKLSFPQLKLSVEPGVDAIGYISNIEGVLQRFEQVLKTERDIAEEDEDKTKCKNLLKKIWKIKCGDVPTKMIIEDPTGNSLVVSDKAVIEKLKGKKEKE